LKPVTQLLSSTLDDETIARFRDKGVEVEDATEAPWQVLFRGPEAALRELLAEDWGLSTDDIELVIAKASDTDLNSPHLP